MHDSILFSKISEEMNQLCHSNKMKKVNKLVVIVNHRSHVNADNLFEHLNYANKDLIGAWTNIQVNRDDIQDQTAILQTIEGEKGEE